MDLIRLRELEELLGDLIDDVAVIGPEEVSPHLPKGHRPGDVMPDVRSVVVHITALKHTVGRYRPGGWWNNRYQHVRAVNNLISAFLKKAGYRTVCPSPWGHNRRTLMPKLQFKPLAVLAGMGWMGRNNLVIHPVFGPRIVIGVVLTDALIERTKRPRLGNGCGDCDICLHVCPIGALRPDGSFDRFKCYHRRRLLNRPCKFLCMRACPIGADYEC